MEGEGLVPLLVDAVAEAPVEAVAEPLVEAVAAPPVEAAAEPAETVPEVVPAPAPAPASPTPRRRGRWIAVGLVVLILLAAGGGAWYENGVLSARYSPQSAVLNYFAAQARGDADDMIANSSFQQPDGAFAEFFGRDALAAMLLLPQNTDVSNVRVQAVRSIDTSNAEVTVSLSWNNSDVTQTYPVRKDPTQAHYVFYDSWRVQIPYTVITVTLPNQPGLVTVDGIAWPSTGPANTLKLIAGYHTVQMLPTPFWQSESITAVGVSDFPSVKFTGKLSSQGTAAAGTAIKAAFGHCDASKYAGCPNARYNAPGGPYTWFLDLPGYGQVQYSYYVYTITGDPTSGMQMVVTADPGKVTASGACTETMTIDGSRNYAYKGTWTATLTWSGSSFSADVLDDCHSSAA